MQVSVEAAVPEGDRIGGRLDDRTEGLKILQNVKSLASAANHFV
jgi:hypothetical protein